MLRVLVKDKVSIDFSDTFFLLVKHSNLRLVFALCVKLNLNICHLDAVITFWDTKEKCAHEKSESFNGQHTVNHSKKVLK